MCRTVLSCHLSQRVGCVRRDLDCVHRDEGVELVDDPGVDLELVGRRPRKLFEGGLAPAVSYATGNSPQAVAVADFNGDGKLDLATANYGSNTVSRVNARSGRLQMTIKVGSGESEKLARPDAAEECGPAHRSVAVR